MKQPTAFDTSTRPDRFGIGQPVRRSEDNRLLTGRGRYVDDIALDDEAVGHVLRSPVASARIRSIDLAAARAMEGVRLVLTAAELEAAGVGTLPCNEQVRNRDGSLAPLPDYPVLATGRVRYAGEPVAFIVAENRAQARDAAEAIEVDYDITEPVVETAAADRDGRPLVHDEVSGNIAFDWLAGDEAATEAAFAGAAHVTCLDLVNNRVVANPVETRAALAQWDAGEEKLTLYANTQGGWDLKAFLAGTVLNVDAEKVRVVTPDVGGGFGMKAVIYPEPVLCAVAARALGRPVRWTGDRGESFLSDTMGRDHVTRAELALDADDRIVGLRVTTRANMGAYLSQFAPFIPTGAAFKVLTGIYDVPAASYRVIGVFTNTTPVDAYRGAGRPESNYMIERLVDRTARERGLDPAEFRRRNMISATAMPFTTVAGETYDTGDFSTVMDAARARADTAGFAARKAVSAQAGKRRGLGMACYIESTMGDPMEFADIRFAPSRRISVAVGTQSNGQGHETAYAQVAAARLGVPFEAIDIVQGDTDVIAWGGGTGGSRSLTAQAAAINVAGDEVIEKARALAAEDFEAAVGDVDFAEGALTVAGTDLRTTLMELAEAHPGALDTRARADIGNWTFPNGCHIAEVEIDEETGVARVVRYTIVDDFGIVVNPMLVAGQVIGGVVQGIGQAFCEQAVFDASGQLVTGSFMDYCMPRADQLPQFDFSYVEIPSANNEMGIKGCGEAGTIAAPPAVMNAVVDALWRGPGQRVPAIDMPVTPEKVWAALRA